MTKKQKISERNSRAAKIGVEKRNKRFSPKKLRDYYVSLQAKRKVRRGRYSKPVGDNSTDTPEKVNKIRGF